MKSINFPQYSDEELLTILKHRVMDYRALFPNTYSNLILERIADLAAGGARIAIQTLKNAAFIAERSCESRISDQDLSKAYVEVKEIKKKYYLERLTSHHKLIVEITQKNPGILSKDLYDDYVLQAKKSGVTPKSKRTISNYINQLIEFNYLKVDRAKARGNVRSFRIT